jgi:hypothetical protein
MSRIDSSRTLRTRIASRLRRRPLEVPRLDYVERSFEPTVSRLRTRLARLEHGHDPVLVGPFDGEVGYELLYWIPLIRWLVEEFPRLRGRLVILSRGGTADWYDGLDARYLDLFSIASPEELRDQRQTTKQRVVNDFERELVERAKARLGIETAAELHPSVFFKLYYTLLRIDRYAFARSVRESASGRVGLLARYEQLTRPPRAVLGDALPRDYVAVRFYFRPSFDDSRETRTFARETIESLAATTDVVLLNTRMELDDHADFDDVIRDDRVHVLHHAMTPETNLTVQTAAIAHARAFVGTYGGLAYLAPFLGVPSISFSSRSAHTFHGHLELALRIFDGPGWGRLLSLETADVSLLEPLLVPRLLDPPASAREATG